MEERKLPHGRGGVYRQDWSGCTARRGPSRRARCCEVAAGFAKTFEGEPEALFSAPGRTELGGNHTDHQHGCVLAAAVDHADTAEVTLTGTDIIRVDSEGYKPWRST